ncbi:MAG TPA: 3'(2'),5'-bisphosphate nucleotidase CysQ [Xanthobacteraceae bacterium]|nr:3'(2'),5'-bisphosphate nucleotidase CysQ [Xanthobacteraceae bacterium]
MPAVDPRSEIARLSERLAAAVREAGELALGKFRAPLKSWTKDRHSIVCEADIASNELLQDRLQAASSDIAWLSEESLDDPARLQARRVWVVDPIDGTRAYIEGRPDWSIAAALVEAGRPVAAALFAPVEDAMFLAVAGQGATLNGGRIATTPEREALRIAGPAGLLQRLQSAELPFQPIRKIHSLALRFARVAQGAIDAALASGNSHDWDLAAADLLVHEAGGFLTTFAGQSLIYNRADPVHAPLVAAARASHRKLLPLLRDQRIHPVRMTKNQKG